MLCADEQERVAWESNQVIFRKILNKENLSSQTTGPDFVYKAILTLFLFGLGFSNI